jgi:hypothetical protein
MADILVVNLPDLIVVTQHTNPIGNQAEPLERVYAAFQG